MEHDRMKRLVVVFSLSVLLAVLFTSPVQADLYTGVISGWAEDGPWTTVGDGTNGVTLWWSINTYNRGWFYGSAYAMPGDPFASDVAFASGVTDISQITDASIYGFTSMWVGPQSDADDNISGVGDFLVWRNTATGHYAVVRLDDIYLPAGATDLLDAELNATWWFQDDGTGDFSGNVVPLPGAMLLGSIGLGLAGYRLKRKEQ